jgi:AraC-like DNA-binding protein
MGAERSQPSPMFVFSHSGNFRVHSSAAVGLVDCTRVAFFNRGVPFQMAHPFGGGDSGSDLIIRPDVLTEILSRYDPGAADRLDRPFPVGSGPCDAPSYLLHRALVRKVTESAPVNELEIEELSLRLADRLARAALDDSTKPAAPSRPTSRERGEVEQILGLLSAHPGRRHRLDGLARRVESSPFKICRSFRAVTGTSIHRHLTQIRLRQALGRIAEGSRDLTDVAFELGFSSHSHFTNVFRKSFGATPEVVRRAVNTRGIAGLRSRLDAAPAATI